MSSGDLFRAIESGDIQKIQRSLTDGADVNSVNKYGKTLLEIASRVGKTDIFKLLLENGADTSGKIINREHLIHLIGTDVILLEDRTVSDYLEEDSLNFVILDGNNPYFSNVNDLDKSMDDGLVFECKELDSLNPDNILFNVELFNARKIGTISGYFTASSLRDAMGYVVRENKRIFRTSDSIRSIPAVVSQKVFERRTSIVSADHCQSGADGSVKELEIVNVLNIPQISTYRSLDLKNDWVVVTNAYIIANNSSLRGEYPTAIREEVNRQFDSIPNKDSYPRIRQNIEDVSLDISNLADVKILTDACRVFLPTIEKVIISDSTINDFSFLESIRGLTGLYSKQRVNSRSIVANLKRHTKTLRHLSIPIDNTLSDLSGYKSLRKVRLSNFGNHHRVIESLAGVRNLEHLYLESYDFSGSIEGLKNLKSLRKLDLRFNRFDNDLNILSNMRRLQDLYLYLPNFEGSLGHIHFLHDLDTLKIVSNVGTYPDLKSFKRNNTQSPPRRRGFSPIRAIRERMRGAPSSPTRTEDTRNTDNSHEQNPSGISYRNRERRVFQPLQDIRR